jgi:hypothetical protein
MNLWLELLGVLFFAMAGMPWAALCCCDCTKPLDCSTKPATLHFTVTSDCTFYDGWTGTLNQDGCEWANFAGEQGGACDFPDYMVFTLVMTDCCDTTRLQMAGECGNTFLDQDPDTGGYAPIVCVDDPFEISFAFDFIMDGSGTIPPGSCECCENGTTFSMQITITE